MVKVEKIKSEVDTSINPVEFFKKLSDNGKQNNCILLESGDIIKQVGEKSIGSCSPSLKISGKESEFEIFALNELGKKLLPFIKEDLDFCEEINSTENKISGKISQNNKLVSEEERLNSITLIDVLRKINLKFKTNGKDLSMGLFGAISYDFIEQFEDLEKNKSDLTNDKDFEMLFLDNLFLIDHQKNKTTFFANYFPEIESNGKKRCEEIIKNYKKTFEDKKANENKETIYPEKKLEITSDMNKKEYVAGVEKCKNNIVNGDVFQIVLSKTKIIKAITNPIKIYSKLKKINLSPYMFYFKTDKGILLGSSPETFIKVSKQNEENKIEIRPIAGTRPRGFKENGKIDYDLDSRYEVELKNDKKEIAEHTMLVDLARNDVARVCKPGTRFVNKPFNVEKYSHVMHIVSNVKGILKKEYDALHAYLASMNMGTLTGAPKVKAMNLLRQYEKNKRGYYGGSVAYFGSNGLFDSAIVIRSIRIIDSTAYVRSGAGIVFDSEPEKEYEETEKKAMACIKAIKEAEGII